MRHQAIYNLYPNAVTINEAFGIFDKDNNKIEINEELVYKEQLRLNQEYSSKQYQRDRATAYPPITDYLDGLVKNDQAQIDKYIADCLAVKSKYPKDSV
jgi:hypothetical protein